jgi:hypothetical protein
VFLQKIYECNAEDFSDERDVAVSLKKEPLVKRYNTFFRRGLAVKMLVLMACCAVNSVFAGENGGFLFVTFRSESSPMTEQVYFMVSEDGYDWTALNNSEPILVSTVGEKGVRDSFILRSRDGSAFYLIATDLSINLNDDWNRAQTAGSQSIVVENFTVSLRYAL